MITTAKEYNEKLGLIQDANYPTTALLLPQDEFIYEIDLNTRIIKSPNFLGVEKTMLLKPSILLRIDFLAV